MFRPDCWLLQPCRYLQGLFMLVAGLALLAVALAAIPLWLQLMLMLAVLSYGVVLIRRYAWLSHRLSVVAIYWDEQGWRLRLRCGEQLAVLPGSQRFWGDRLLLLEFISAAGQHFAVPLFVGSQARTEAWANGGAKTEQVPGSLRRLRVCLIHGSIKSAEPQG